MNDIASFPEMLRRDGGTTSPVSRTRYLVNTVEKDGFKFVNHSPGTLHVDWCAAHSIRSDSASSAVTGVNCC